jgi:hypothetical protein
MGSGSYPWFFLIPSADADGTDPEVLDPEYSRCSPLRPALPAGRAADTKTRPDTRYQAESFLIDAPCALEPTYAVNEEPQPQLPVAFGLVKVKPDPITFVT